VKVGFVWLLSVRKKGLELCHSKQTREQTFFELSQRVKYFLRYDFGFTEALRLVFEIPTVGFQK
jgi:hypothetical protein